MVRWLLGGGGGLCRRQSLFEKDGRETFGPRDGSDGEVGAQAEHGGGSSVDAESTAAMRLAELVPPLVKCWRRSLLAAHRSRCEDDAAISCGFQKGHQGHP